MKMDMNITRKLKRPLATVSAVGALLLAGPALAQSGANQQSQQSQAPQEFSELDQNQDQKLSWEEIQQGLEERLSQSNLEREQVLSQFDQDRDQSLNEQEYSLLIAELGRSTGQQSAQSQEIVVDAQQPRIAVEQQKPQVSVDPAEPQVDVQQRAPEVSVQQQKPQVDVQQPTPKVIVQQKEPEVSVNVPEPDVQLVQPDPEVSVQQPQPEVQVEQQPPEVAVQQGQPDVQVQQPEPEVSVQPATPEVSMGEQQQAEVQVQERERAKVQVQQAEPDVQVTQAEPEVNVERTEGATVGDIEGMEAPAAGIPQEQDPQVQQAQSAETNPLYDIQITELQDQQVVNANGEEVGEVDQVVMGQSANDLGVIVSVGGGFFGMGGEQVLIPIDDLSMQGEQLVWNSATDKQQIEQAREFNRQEYRELSPDQYRTLRDAETATGQ